MVEGLREQHMMAGVAASELGAKEKHSVPLVWPWCKETNPWRESAEQRGAARRSASAGWGPRTHEDGGAEGAPRRCAGLRPTGHLGERGSPVERRGKRCTMPLHKASRRVADTSHAVLVVTLRVAAWKIATARSTSG